MLLPTVPLTEAIKTESYRIFSVTLKPWEVALGLILIVVGPAFMIGAHIIMCTVFVSMIPVYIFWGAAVGTLITTPVFIIWKIACNSRIKTKWPRSLIPYNPTPKYTLEVSTEVTRRIAKLELLEFAQLPEAAQKVCAHCGVFDTAGMRKCILSALKKPYSQSGPNCFAAAHFARWQANFQVLVVNILYQLFRYGKFKYTVSTGVTEEMSPFLKKGSSSAGEMVVDSISKLFEEKSTQNDENSMKASWLFAEIRKVVEKIDNNPAMEKILEKYLAKSLDLTGQKKIEDICLYYYELFRCKMEHRGSGWFSLNISLNAFFKGCGMPSALRKCLITRLGAQPLCSCVGNDVLFAGHYDQMCERIFSSAACTSLWDGNDPREFLIKLCELKKRSGQLPPGKLFPIHMTFMSGPENSLGEHTANAIIPDVNDVNEVKDGQFIPLVWTGWCPTFQYGIIRQNNTFEWKDARGQHVTMVNLQLFDPEKNIFTPVDDLPSP
ncbi:MAG: hypothetical protein LBB26_02305 [Puniceicoccales bacterium]|nr:hypothetical protein [Puniceicoccales bacterium]